MNNARLDERGRVDAVRKMVADGRNPFELVGRQGVRWEHVDAILFEMEDAADRGGGLTPSDYELD